MVKNGDSVKLDVENRRLDLLVSEAELRSRMEAWCPAHKKYRRGYYTMRVAVIDEPPYERGAETQVIEHYVRALEAEIRTSPADWLWIHRKWKYPKPSGPAQRRGDASTDGVG